MNTASSIPATILSSDAQELGSGSAQEWLWGSLPFSTENSVTQMTLQLGSAFLCGCTIALIFRAVRPREHYQPTFPSTLVLMTILCAMLPLVIGQNVAWAFGLVGALSIVRFRTVIEDTHDITFVIFAVLVGMAVGAEQMTVAVVGIAVTGGAAYLIRPRAANKAWTAGHARLSIRMGADQKPEILLTTIFDQFLDRFELISGGTSKQGAVLDLSYRIRMRGNTNPTNLINQLNLIDGVRSVELRQGR